MPWTGTLRCCLATEGWEPTASDQSGEIMGDYSFLAMLSVIGVVLVAFGVRYRH